MIHFTIPMPPSTNALFATVKGRRIKTRTYKAWITEAGWMVLQQRQAGKTWVTGDCVVSIIAGPRNRRADLDNKVKACLDLLKRQSLIVDDSDVVELHIRWGDVDGLDVTIRGVGP